MNSIEFKNHLILDPIVAHLLEIRKRLGYSQQNLADMSGVSRRTLASIEAGGNCTLSTLRSLCAALDVQLTTGHHDDNAMPTLDEMTEENRRERFGRDGT